MPHHSRVAFAWLSRNVAPHHRLHHEIRTRGVDDVVAELIAGTASPRLQGLVHTSRAPGSLTAAEAELDHATSIGIRFVTPGDNGDWPNLQFDAAIPRVPYGLWVRGGPDILGTVLGSIAIVGSRACTAYGAHVAGDLAQGLALDGRTIVSGGALGVDAAAHRGALAAQAGHTVAVLAHGVDRVYPAQHRDLFQAIVDDGGLLVSEYPPGSPPQGYRFLERDRLIAALTVGTVVVEAAARSGSLATARAAHDAGRHLMAIPGPVTSAMSVGTHGLLRNGLARLVTCAADVQQVLRS